MKKILLSVHPKYCKLIFNGEKTIEVRRSFPKLEPPFEVLVYCTKQMLTKTKCMYSYLHKNEPKACKKYGEIATWANIGDVQVNSNTPWSFRSYGMHGKVIGSFVCDNVRSYIPLGLRGYELPQEWLGDMCLTKDELDKYGGLITLYGWHITEPKLFDEPREFYELYAPCKKNKQTADENCKGCVYAYKGTTTGEIYCDNALIRPPQSFCYVEDINEI